MTTRRHPRLEQAGFTLFELMMVAAIILLVLAWGMPNMLRAVQKQGINKAAADLMEGCKQARAYAILTGEPAELVIRAEDGQMIVRKAAAPRLMRQSGGRAVGVSAAGKAQEGKLTGFRRAFDEDIALEMFDVNFVDQMQFPEGIVRFYPNGTSDELTIVLLSTNNERRQVSLDPVTAVALMENWENRS